MLWLRPYTWVNRNGSAAIASTGVVTQAVTKFNGEALTVADVLGTGVVQLWFERDTNTLQLMTGIV